MKRFSFEIFLTYLFAVGWAIGLGTAPADLVMYWPLDEPVGTSGEGSVQDVVGANPGTPGNGVTFGEPGANASTGTSARFSGSGGIQAPWSAVLNPENFTFTAWVNVSSTSSWNSVTTSREDNGSTVNGYILYNSPEGVWDFWTGAGGPTGAWSRTTGPAAETNTWTHLAISYDKESDVKLLYVDGVEAARGEGLGYVPNGTEEQFQRPFNLGSGQDFGDGFFLTGNIDDVAIFNEALSPEDIVSIMNGGVASLLGDPGLSVARTLDLDFTPTLGTVSVPVRNSGQTRELVISDATISDDAKGNFSVLNVPAAIPPGASGVIEIQVDPKGEAGLFSSTLTITSNAAASPSVEVSLTGVVRDPVLAVESQVDLGEFAINSGPHEAQVVVKNLGASRALTLSDVSIAGTSAAAFSVVVPEPIPAGGEGILAVTFSPDDRFGSFSATIGFQTDDARLPSASVTLRAKVLNPNPLVAYWPFDDAVGTDGEGAVLDVFGGFNGTPTGGITFGEPGANVKTGTSARFAGEGAVQIPFNSALNPEDFTFTAWVNIEETGGWNAVVTSREDNGQTVNGLILYNSPDGQWDFWTGAGGATGAWQRATAPDAAEVDTWTHLAISYDKAANAKVLYVNGEVAAEGQGYVPNGTTEETQRPFNIGAGQDNGDGFFFTGRIDDVGFFGVPLDQETIKQVMNNGVLSIIGDPNLNLPAVIDFGALAGVFGTQRKSFALTNTGTDNELIITGSRITGENASLFSVGSLPSTLAPGASANVEFGFVVPQETGIFRAVLEIESNDEKEPTTRIQLVAKIENANRLLAHYKMDETGGAEMRDASGNGYHGIYGSANGGSYTLGVPGLGSGTAVKFSDGGAGGAGYGEIPADAGLPSLGVASYAFWVRIDPEDAGTTSALFGLGETPGDPFGVALEVTGDLDPVQWISDGSESSLVTDPLLKAGEIYHLVFAYVDENGAAEATLDRLRVYLNGELVGEALGTPGFDPRKGGPFQIGAAASFLGLTGVVDDFQIYQKELSAEDAAYLFANPGKPLASPELPTAAAAFEVGSVTRVGDEVSLTWPVDAGKTYAVQVSADLKSWTDVQNGLTAGNASIAVTEAMRFFRVAVE